jgi:nucleoside-diphosphate-sugar epimerase
MEIVGTGFLARHLQTLSGTRPDVVVLAAGVSSAISTSAADFARERALLRIVARRCRATRRQLVFFSTASTGMYGGTDGAGREDVPVTPCSPYGAHKLALEEDLREAGTGFLVLRLAHVTGPGQPAHQLLPSLTRQVRAGWVMVQRGASRDLIGIGDVVTIIGMLLDADVRDQTINVASGWDVPVELIVDHLAQRLGRDPEREYVEGGRRNQVSVAKLLEAAAAVRNGQWPHPPGDVPGRNSSDQRWSTHAFPG